ncbi:MAG: hypothetical protein RLZZ276_482, partial [Pseudomonadota bacterium]
MTEATQASTPDFAPTNAMERIVVNVGKVLSFGYAVSILVTIYDVAMDKLATPTIWVYDVV